MKSEEQLISVAVEKARVIFNAPDLNYAPDLVFQKIRGFDSVQAVQFILALEVELNVTLSEEDVDNMHTMGDMLDILKGKFTE